MPKPQTDALLQLMSSMTKSEKRHFRIFVNRNQTTEDALFMRLFDELEKMKSYEEDVILKKIPNIKKQQLSNLKAHLYKQILLCLRLVHRNYNEDIDLHEKLDYARILYNKGLYKQSLEMLDKTKQGALRLNIHTLALEAIEFEKQIESQYVTGSKSDRAEQLANESTQLSEIIKRQQSFSNLSLQLLSLYLKVGYARNQKDYFYAKEFFNSHLPKYNFEELTFTEKLSLTQSYVEFYSLTQDFLMVFKHAQKWVELFEENTEMMDSNAPNYLRGLHNLLISLFFLNQHDRFVATLEKLENFTKERQQKDANTESLAQLYVYVHCINLHYMLGTFTEGLKWIPELEKIIKDNTFGWDENRNLVFHYKIACLYFGSGKQSKAIDHLNVIINSRNPDYREDIQCFARILNLICHYELGNMQLVEYQAKSVYRFLLKTGDLHEVQRLVLQFIRKMPFMTPNLVKKEFASLKNSLEKVKEMPYEKRPFLYLDIISWLECKIQNKKVEDIIKEKFLAHNKAS
jgi:hypothetical protein